MPFKKKKPPKLRAWGPAVKRKVMTMVIPSKKNKLRRRTRRKEETLKEIAEERSI